MNRFDRITAILIHLQSRKIVTSQHLSDRFKVSQRTIYRDIRTLEEAGVPILSEAGVGYSIMDGYRLPPVMFTREEAVSMVTAEKLMDKMVDKVLGEHYQSAMYKVRAVLKHSEKEWLQLLESQIQIFPGHSPVNAKIPNTLELILKSIAEQKVVHLRYKAFMADDSIDRIIEPVGIFHENQFWYVFAFCQTRQDYRQFRADRMEQLRVSGDSFTRIHEDLEHYRKKKFAYSSDKQEITLLVPASAYRYIHSQSKYFGVVREKKIGKSVEMTFLHEVDCDGMARWYLMYADTVQIIGPEDFRYHVEDLLEKIQINLKISETILT
jgi:predicted DNA-binding transcriptional regulator YafY